MAPSHTMPNLLAPPSNGALTPAASGMAGHGQNGMLSSGLTYDANPSSYDFFDPQHWMLDNLLDFNYTYVQPLESV